MHRLWNLACESFLLKFCTGDWDAELPNDKPRRGSILPRQAQPLASGCSAKQANATSSYANELSKVVGIVSDLSKRLRRWTTPEQGVQQDTDLGIRVHLHLGQGATS